MRKSVPQKQPCVLVSPTSADLGTAGLNTSSVPCSDRLVKNRFAIKCLPRATIKNFITNRRQSWSFLDFFCYVCYFFDYQKRAFLKKKNKKNCREDELTLSCVRTRQIFITSNALANLSLHTKFNIFFFDIDS